MWSFLKKKIVEKYDKSRPHGYRESAILKKIFSTFSTIQTYVIIF